MTWQKDLLNRKSLRAALRRWGRSEALGDHGLARLQIVTNKRLESGYSDTSLGDGIALREVLQESIRELMPAQEEPDRLEKRWRPYLILSEQFIHGRSPDYVAELLGIARSTYNHEQASALDTIVELLNQKEFLLSSSGTVDEDASHPPPSSMSIPFLAPPRPHYAIIGREQLLQDLKKRLTSGSGLRAAAIYGLPGVGKTTMAIELANDPDLKDHFTDGVLWAGLGRNPDIMGILSLWGRALGIPTDEVARLHLLEERTKAIHAAIGMRRLLLIIDDVWESDEGLALKIGGPHCAYLVTSRLPGIAMEFAGDGASAIEELNLMDGLRLLAQFSPSVVDESSQDARALVKDVGGLPLALMLMGRYLQKEARAGQEGRLRRALNRLRQTEERMLLSYLPSPLDQQPSLPTGAPLSLRAVIAISGSALDAVLQRALQALSEFPPKPNTFSAKAACEISRTTVDHLDILVDSGLLEPRPPDRFTLHQTIVEYSQLEGSDRAAQGRFVKFFVQYLVEHKEDFEVLEPETRNIFTALSLAEKLEMWTELVKGANSFFPFMVARGLFEPAEKHLRIAAAAAREGKDAPGLLDTLVHQGNISHRYADYENAESFYQEALEISGREDSGERLGEIFNGLGIVAFSSGKYADAEGWFQRGLQWTSKMRDRNLETGLLTNLGVLLFNMGNQAEAEKHFLKGLTTARAMEDRETICRLLINLGVIAARRWEYERAERRFQESLELARGAGRRDTMSFLLTNLGTLANDQGQLDLAEQYFQEALSVAREINDRARVSHLLANLGVLASTGGDHAQANAHLAEGLKIARHIGHRENVCLLLTNFGVLARERGDYDEAGEYFDEALILARKMGHRRYEASVCLNQGELYLHQDAGDDAVESFQQSLAIAEELQLQEIVAAAKFGLARWSMHQGDKQEACMLGEQSLAVFQEINHLKTKEVKGWLAGL